MDRFPTVRELTVLHAGRTESTVTYLLSRRCAGERSGSGLMDMNPPAPMRSQGAIIAAQGPYYGLRRSWDAKGARTP